MKHRPRIARWCEETPQGEAWCYRVECPCGEEFGTHYTKKFAESDLLRHRMGVAPPASERCRDPQQHRMQPWDRCPVCVDQLPLPGFEHLGAPG